MSGTASPSIVMEHQSLIHGNEILVNIVKGYEASATKRYGQSKHTLKNVLSVLNDDQIGLPMGWTPPHGVSTPTGLMIGYLMFDVLIGNTDRHHENWAIVLDSSVHLNTDPGGFISPATPGEWLLRMAPTFDHASSLGAHLVDSKRTSILAAENGFPMEGYVEKARSALYHTEDDSKAMMTIDAFAKAAHYDGAAAKAWVLQVATRSIKEFRVVFDRFPRTRISDVAADFAVALLDANRRRLVSLMESWS
ncbi:MAG: hypothetical protein HZA51_00775 [Planctomycetes bacterium]|nr:hypothetical protein [Planctomycetota bacterium]